MRYYYAEEYCSIDIPEHVQHYFDYEAYHSQSEFATREEAGVLRFIEAAPFCFIFARECFIFAEKCFVFTSFLFTFWSFYAIIKSDKLELELTNLEKGEGIRRTAQKE